MPQDTSAIQFTTLEHLSPEALLTTANIAFSDYFIPLQLTIEQFKAKLLNEDVKLELSVGAFDGDLLVGFILHAKRTADNKLLIYNAFTGVVPTYRGNNLTEKMYRFALGVVKPLEPHHLVLEVIEQNDAAIKSYGRVGYDKTRYLKTYRGQVPTVDLKLDIQELYTPDWDYLQTFWDCRPTWQNDTPTLQKTGTGTTYGVIINEVIVGYIHYNAALKRIAQMAVKHGFRCRGLGKALIAHLAQFEKEITITNIDNKAEGLVSFFESMGWENYINLYEMTMPME